MQSPDYHTDDDAGQPQFTNPRIEVTEHRGAPLLSWSGIAIIQQLMESLGVARALDAGVRVLRRCKWYLQDAFPAIGDGSARLRGASGTVASTGAVAALVRVSPPRSTRTESRAPTSATVGT